MNSEWSSEVGDTWDFADELRIEDMLFERKRILALSPIYEGGDISLTPHRAAAVATLLAHWALSQGVLDADIFDIEEVDGYGV